MRNGKRRGPPLSLTFLVRPRVYELLARPIAHLRSASRQPCSRSRAINPRRGSELPGPTPWVSSYGGGAAWRRRHAQPPARRWAHTGRRGCQRRIDRGSTLPSAAPHCRSAGAPGFPFAAACTLDLPRAPREGAGGTNQGRTSSWRERRLSALVPFGSHRPGVPQPYRSPRWALT